ncbi:MAG: hypothetical protein H6R07_529 [Proteobacteria bacterium]|nr:hypothetical protein [Pseudomonadota bacterium]
MTSRSDYMHDCDPVFDRIGFDRDEIMPIIRTLQTSTGYFDVSGQSYSTPALELQRRYIQALWSTFDPEEPASAPSKEEGLRWLKEEAARMDISLSLNILEAIELIVRHPAARAGASRKRVPTR